MSQFHPLVVSEIHRETRDSVVVTLQVPADKQDRFNFIQGQYLTLRANIGGEEIRRSYSICSAVGEPLRIGIKKVAGGVFSSWANEKIVLGQTLEAMPPMGNFFAPLDAGNRKHYVGFACGSGITPLLGIIKSVLAREPLSSFSLFFGNRASSTIMFREELEDLKSQHLGRFSLVHILSREQQDIDLFNGRLSREKCDLLLDLWIDSNSIDMAFICGPQDMMLQIAESLQAHGLENSQIKFELFAGAPGRAAQRQHVEAPAAGEKCDATVIIDGRSRALSIAKGEGTILDAGLKDGLELPYACKAGVCSTCRALLVEGEVDMDANFALEDYEVARGYILTCQAYPVTDGIVVDFDK